MQTSYLQQLRKAELHLHLEGSVTVDTLLELAPDLDRELVIEKYRHASFGGFLQSFRWLHQQLKTPEDYALIARRLLESLAAQNVAYAEITLSVGVILWKDQAFDAVFDAVHREGLASPVEVRWIFDAIRHFGVEPAERVLELAIEHRSRDVAGFGIGGDEERGPVTWFADLFASAKAEGLIVVPHAGECVGPASVWAAIAAGAQRVGHGITAASDPALMSHLRDHDLPLEICLTSNVKTGVVSSIELHPLRRLYDAGVPIILNTDDPGLFGTTLVNEFTIAAEVFRFSEAELATIAENGFRYQANRL